MKQDTKLKVVCLFGTGIIFDKTLSILLQNDINVVGVCNANKHKNKIDFSYLKIAVKKYGYWNVFLQIIGRFLYKILNAKKDREIFNKIYNVEEINEIIKNKDIDCEIAGNKHIDCNDKIVIMDTDPAIPTKLIDI